MYVGSFEASCMRGHLKLRSCEVIWSFIYEVIWSFMYVGSSKASCIWGHLKFHACEVIWSFMYMRSSEVSCIWGHLKFHVCEVIWSFMYMRSSDVSCMWGHLKLHLWLYHQFLLTDLSPQINPYWTGRTYMSFPGKGRECHICPTNVTSWWRHFDVI